MKTKAPVVRSRTEAAAAPTAASGSSGSSRADASSSSSVPVAESPGTERPKRSPEVIYRHSGAHVILLALKMLRRPALLDELTEISKTKLSKGNRPKCVKRLLQYGYVTSFIDDQGEQRLLITQKGIDKIYELAAPPK